MKFYFRVKRIPDICFAFLLILLFSPVLLLIASAILLFEGKPVFFCQVRAGRNGKPFTVYKFRTMEQTLPGAHRFDTQKISTLGSFLRRFGLDELPQIFNILRGEMSFIGPRPLLCDYLPLYTKQQWSRQEILPGITGWAQVHGRNAITWEKRLELDCWYVEHASLFVDCRIIWMTVQCIFTASGVNYSPEITMLPFKATRDASLLILGAGGHGQVVADAARETGLYKRISFLDDKTATETGNTCKILGHFDDYERVRREFANAAVAIGDNRLRLNLINRLEQAGYHLPVIVHPSAHISSEASVEPGSIILGGAIVATGAHIGKGCIINTLAGIDHGCVLGDCVHVCPGSHLAGNVRVGQMTTVYTGASIANNISIGEQSRIAAGAAVVCDIPSGVMAAGVPAMVKKRLHTPR